MVKEITDFDKVPEGGCLLECGATLICGHNCTRLCHLDDVDHQMYQCEMSCTK